MTSSKLELQIHQHDFITVPSVFSLFWTFLIALGPLRKKIERGEREEAEARG